MPRSSLLVTAIEQRGFIYCDTGFRLRVSYEEILIVYFIKNGVKNVLLFEVEMPRRYHLPSEKCMALHLNKLESLLLKDTLCQVRLILFKWLLRSRWKCEKFIDGQTDEQIDRRTTGSEKLTWAISSYEQKSHVLFFIH